SNQTDAPDPLLAQVAICPKIPDDGQVKVDYSASDAATVDTVATFDGLGDLSGLNSDNILHTDPTGAGA
ncbi:hypothetical protein, partial [uncultured Ruegeria sp.]|uniref:hypothetical protein n=1 Tax=uncultured Ruegeria sp. TaxID=259304 RepID=UPI002631EF99